jgi:hypothetical protein
VNARFNALVALSAAWITASAFGQFSNDPANQLVVANQAGDQNQPKIRLAPDGSFSVSYLSTQGTGWDTWIQRLTSAGNEVFAHDGIVSDDTNFSSTEDYGLAVDSNGNTIIAFRDDHTGTTTLGLQKVAPDGTLPWGPYGIAIPGGPAGSTDVPHSPGVVCTSDGGYAVRFTRGTSTTTATARACYQKVDANGNLLWNGGQAVVFAPTTNGFEAADMVASDNGNVIAFIYTIGSFTVSRRVEVMKLHSATGASLWNSGLPIVIQTASTLQSGYFPIVVPDASNGALVAWYETTNNAYMCRAQHVDVSGNLLFPAGGAAVASTTGRLRVSPWMAYDAATSSTYMLYTESDTAQSVWAVNSQKFDSSGTRQWGEGGLALMADSSFQPSFTEIATTPGGVIGAWFMQTAPTSQVVQAAKITSAGTLAWPGNGIITVDSNSGAKTRMDARANSDGSAVIVYGDGFDGSLDIMASRINPDGTLGNPAPTTGSCCTRNTCTITAQADCTGTWTAGGVCTGPSSCGHFCGSADFNCDGAIGTDADIESFFDCISGSCPGLPCISNADFNGDGAIGTDADIESFFVVLSGGNC